MCDKNLLWFSLGTHTHRSTAETGTGTQHHRSIDSAELDYYNLTAETIDLGVCNVESVTQIQGQRMDNAASAGTRYKYSTLSSPYCSTTGSLATTELHLYTVVKWVDKHCSAWLGIKSQTAHQSTAVHARNTVSYGRKSWHRDQHSSCYACLDIHWTSHVWNAVKARITVV